MSGANKTSTRRPNREEIVDLFRACAAKNDGMAPGKGLFQKTSGVTEAQVKYHFWKGGYTELAQEAGLEPNLFNQTRLDDDQVFSDYAKICLHIQSVPNERQLRGAQRELGARTHTVGTRFDGWLEEFQQRFRHWLANQRPELRTIMGFAGWRVSKADGAGEPSSAARAGPSFHRSFRRPCNIWMFLRVATGHHSSSANSQSARSLSGEPLTPFVAWALRLLN